PADHRAERESHRPGAAHDDPRGAGVLSERHRGGARRRRHPRGCAVHRARRHRRSAARPARGRRAGRLVRVTGVLQAGGKSTGLGGEAEALLELGGRRIIERVLDAVVPVVDDVLIVTNTPALYAFLGVPMAPAFYRDHGALGGISSGLAAASGEAAFTVASDMPFLHPPVVQLVIGRAGQADVVTPRVGAPPAPMHALSRTDRL